MRRDDHFDDYRSGKRNDQRERGHWNRAPQSHNQRREQDDKELRHARSTPTGGRPPRGNRDREDRGDKGDRGDGPRHSNYDSNQRRGQRDTISHGKRPEEGGPRRDGTRAKDEVHREQAFVETKDLAFKSKANPPQGRDWAASGPSSLPAQFPDQPAKSTTKADSPEESMPVGTLIFENSRIAASRQRKDSYKHQQAPHFHDRKDQSHPDRPGKERDRDRDRNRKQARKPMEPSHSYQGKFPREIDARQILDDIRNRKEIKSSRSGDLENRRSGDWGEAPMNDIPDSHFGRATETALPSNEGEPQPDTYQTWAKVQQTEKPWDIDDEPDALSQEREAEEPENTDNNFVSPVPPVEQPPPAPSLPVPNDPPFKNSDPICQDWSLITEDVDYGTGEVFIPDPIEEEPNNYDAPRYSSRDSNWSNGGGSRDSPEHSSKSTNNRSGSSYHHRQDDNYQDRLPGSPRGHGPNQQGHRGQRKQGSRDYQQNLPPRLQRLQQMKQQQQVNQGRGPHDSKPDSSRSPPSTSSQRSQRHNNASPFSPEKIGPKAPDLHHRGVIKIPPEAFNQQLRQEQLEMQRKESQQRYLEELRASSNKPYAAVRPTRISSDQQQHQSSSSNTHQSHHQPSRNSTQQQSQHHSNSNSTSNMPSYSNNHQDPQQLIANFAAVMRNSFFYPHLNAMAAAGHPMNASQYNNQHHQNFQQLRCRDDDLTSKALGEANSRDIGVENKLGDSMRRMSLNHVDEQHYQRNHPSQHHQQEQLTQGPPRKKSL